VSAGPNQGNRHDGISDVFIPNPAHDVVRIGAVDEVILVGHAYVPCDEYAAEFF
jgi:hypothetical protein